MITVVISGPNTDDRRKLTEQLRSLLMTSGKIVRFYQDSRDMPEEIPPCDVVITVKHQETSNGK